MKINPTLKPKQSHFKLVATVEDLKITSMDSNPGQKFSEETQRDHKNLRDLVSSKSKPKTITNQTPVTQQTPVPENPAQ